MLKIFQRPAHEVGMYDEGIHWTKGSARPKINTFNTVTFQADGDEAELIANCIRTNSKKDLIDYAWEWRGNKIEVIKEIRTRFPGIGLLEAKLFAESLIDHAEKKSHQ